MLARSHTNWVRECIPAFCGGPGAFFKGFGRSFPAGLFEDLDKILRSVRATPTLSRRHDAWMLQRERLSFSSRQTTPLCEAHKTDTARLRCSKQAIVFWCDSCHDTLHDDSSKATIKGSTIYDPHIVYVDIRQVPKPATAARHESRQLP